MGYDLILRNATVVDGTGGDAYEASIAVLDGRIAAIERGDALDCAECDREIDCRGKTMTPGFIDIHSHADWLVPGADHGSLVEPFVRQGMTTLLGGNCGFSPAPITDKNLQAASDASQVILDDAIDLRWKTMDGFLTALEGDGVALNIAQLVGHGAVRAAVRGHLDPTPPDAEALAAMERYTRAALEEGAIGSSTGLGYPPGIFAGHDELAAFAGWTADAGRLFTSHLRAYSATSGVYADENPRAHNLRAIDEILAVGRDSGVRLQISHLIFVGRNSWPTHGEAIGLIERALSEGVDVAFDAFPYTAGNTTASVIFPPEILPSLEAMLADPEQMAALRAFGEEVFDRIGFHLRDIQIMNACVDRFEELNGLFVGEAADRVDMEIWEFYSRLVIESGRNARVLIHKYSGDEDDESALRAVLAHPLCTIETDTFVTERGHQNPASYGTFPRVLSTYVREGLFSFEEAVRKMTGAPADRIGWADRGYVREGAVADLVVLDKSTLVDRASFSQPDLFPVGIERVMVGGTVVLEDGIYDANAGAGEVIRA